MAGVLGVKYLVDMGMLIVAWVASYYVRFYGGLAVPMGIPEPWLYFKLIPFIVMIWSGTFYLTGFYHRSRFQRSAFLEGLDVVQSCILATVAFISFTYFYEEYRYSRINTAIFSLMQVAFIVGGRSGLRKVLRFYARKSPLKRILVIAHPDRIEDSFNLCIHNRVERLGIGGVIALGMVGEGQKEELHRKGIDLIDEPKDWVQFFINHSFNSVFIAAHAGSPFIKDHLEQIVEQVPEVKIMPDFGKFTQLSMGIEMVSGLPIVSLHESPLSGVSSLLKRAFDIGGSLSCLLLLSPLMVLIGLLIKISSKGPILYRQERMGLDGIRFNCYKFRSMPVGVEKSSGAVWARAGDNRATTIGKILRRTSLDELPQFFNVLKGDMSLVGPRPERPVFVSEFRRKVPGYMLRHKVKAGITGWAQVNGWRGNTSIEKRIECDLFYIQNWSIWLDLKILIMTVGEVIAGRNAY